MVEKLFPSPQVKKSMIVSNEAWLMLIKWYTGFASQFAEKLKI